MAYPYPGSPLRRLGEYHGALSNIYNPTSDFHTYQKLYMHMSSRNDEEVMGLITTDDTPEGESKKVIISVIRLR
jgi:hypothetical protein